jgi:hypothetical protein
VSISRQGCRHIPNPARSQGVVKVSGRTQCEELVLRSAEKQDLFVVVKKIDHVCESPFVKFVVASPVDEEGDQIHSRIWNHEFIQLPLVIKEKQNRPTITAAEISALLKSVKGRYAVLVALVRLEQGSESVGP